MQPIGKLGHQGRKLAAVPQAHTMFAAQERAPARRVPSPVSTPNKVPDVAWRDEAHGPASAALAALEVLWPSGFVR